MTCRLVLLTLLALGASSVAIAQDGVTVYRCTDASGHLTLRDSPCQGDSRQQVRTMQALPEPPPRRAPPPRAEPVQQAPPPRVIVVRTPQASYECVRPDGSTYASDSNEGNPRYVSVYDRDDGGYGSRFDRGAGDRRSDRFGSPTPVRPPLVGIPYGEGDGTGITPVTPNLVGIPQGSQSIDLPSRPSRPSGRPGRGGYGYEYGGGTTLVRDSCQALPPAEACARLVDRRDDVRRQFFGAQERERARLDREERGINARLAADCGAY